MAVEIYVLSGFLGSGKTTLLKRLLEKEKKQGRKTAVMMNEIGKVSIDSDAVEDDVALKELLGGCICCNLQGQLEAQLQSLLIDEKPEVIYIETTGAAHPVEVLDSVLSPLFADKLEVKSLIITVDGKRWLDRAKLSPQMHQLVLEQVRSGDLIIVNNQDELTDSEQSQVNYEIQSLNSHAKMIFTSYSKIPLELINQKTSVQKLVKEKRTKIDHSLSTFVHQFKDPIKQSEFEDFLRSLPDQIYRIKGYVKFDHSKQPFLFQYSYGMPVYMLEYMNLPLNMVFIGESIDWTDISTKLLALEHTNK